jgi:hypothetical protein
VPLATFTALEGIQIGQSAKPQRSSDEFSSAERSQGSVVDAAAWARTCWRIRHT